MLYGLPACGDGTLTCSARELIEDATGMALPPLGDMPKGRPRAG